MWILGLKGLIQPTAIFKHYFKIPNGRISYNFTPLIRPLVRNLENENTCDMLILLTY